MCAPARNRNLQFQYPNWLVCFALLTNKLNRASIRATLFFEKLRLAGAPIEKPLSGHLYILVLPLGIEPRALVPQTSILSIKLREQVKNLKLVHLFLYSERRSRKKFSGKKFLTGANEKRSKSITFILTSSDF